MRLKESKKVSALKFELKLPSKKKHKVKGLSTGSVSLMIYYRFVIKNKKELIIY